MEGLNFSNQQVYAIYKAADMMVKADSRILPEEEMTVEEGMIKLGFNSQQQQKIKKEALMMSDSTLYETLSNLEANQKKFVTSLLGTIISSDGDIDDEELDLWRDFTEKCEFPFMSNRQAIEIFKQY